MSETSKFPKKRKPIPDDSLQARVIRLEAEKTYYLGQIKAWQESYMALLSRIVEASK